SVHQVGQFVPASLDQFAPAKPGHIKPANLDQFDRRMQYSYRSDESLTYHDLLPGMRLRIEKGLANDDEDRAHVLDTVGYYDVARHPQGYLQLSPYFSSMAAFSVPYDDPATPKATAGAGDCAVQNNSWRYMGVSTPSLLRPVNSASAGGGCLYTSATNKCNQVLIGQTEFATFHQSLLPAFKDCRGSLSLQSIISNCTSETCCHFGSSAYTRIVLSTALMVKNPQGALMPVEMGTLAGSLGSQMGGALKVKRRYKNGYRTVRGPIDELPLLLFDQLKRK
ncbi:hypothetical protein, partial [Paracnuella aquatica]|uniref:hypothetical protein n=1 Tax=Paracnuella aquatica TaxID=2268757 RepID=UPI0013902912